MSDKKILNEIAGAAPPTNRYGDYRFHTKLVGPVSNFYQPDGMAAMGTDPNNLKHPDPDVTHTSISNDVVKAGLYDALKQEWVLYGKDGLYIDGTTATALERFQTTASYSQLFNRGETRWGVRPPIINHLTGGVKNSYHKTGQAVDLKLRKRPSEISQQELMDCVWNALWAGFRGIGFGGNQFHFDTRQSGLIGYIYDKWPYSTPPSEVLKYAFETKAKKARREGDERNFNFFMSGASKVKTKIVRPEQSANRGLSSEFSSSDISTYIRDELDARSEFEKQDLGGGGGSSASGGDQGYIPPPAETTTTTSTAPVTPYFFTQKGRAELVDLGILSAIILGGYFGFKAFLSHLKNRSEKARAEREIRRLYSTKSRRELIGEFRMKNAGAIVRAKRDPRLARELEIKLARILAKNGYPIY